MNTTKTNTIVPISTSSSSSRRFSPAQPICKLTKTNAPKILRISPSQVHAKTTKPKTTKTKTTKPVDEWGVEGEDWDWCCDDCGHQIPKGMEECPCWSLGEKPKTPYGYFLQERIPVLQKKNPSKSEVRKQAKREWDEMSDRRKKKFVTMADDAKASYARRLAKVEEVEEDEEDGFEMIDEEVEEEDEEEDEEDEVEDDEEEDDEEEVEDDEEEEEVEEEEVEEVEEEEEDDTARAGTYALGDPCYLLSSYDYDRLCDTLHERELKNDHQQESEYGAFKTMNKIGKMIVFQTRLGDGQIKVWRDPRGGHKEESLKVDSGMIALIPIDQVDWEDCSDEDDRITFVELKESKVKIGLYSTIGVMMFPEVY